MAVVQWGQACSDETNTASAITDGGVSPCALARWRGLLDWRLQEFLVITSLLDVFGEKVVASGVYAYRKCVFVKGVDHACGFYIGCLWVAATTEMGRLILNESHIEVTA